MALKSLATDTDDESEAVEAASSVWQKLHALEGVLVTLRKRIVVLEQVREADCERFNELRDRVGHQ